MKAQILYNTKGYLQQVSIYIVNRKSVETKQISKHIRNSSLPELPTEYSDMHNMVFKTVAVSFAASLIVHPVDSVAYSLLTPATFSIAKTYSTILSTYRTSMISGQQRGASSGVGHYVKNKSTKDEQEHGRPTAYTIYTNPWVLSAVFSQVDLSSSIYFSNKGRITGAGVSIPTVSAAGGITGYLSNCWVIFKTGYAFRSVGGFVSLASMLKGSEIASGLVPESIRDSKVGYYLAGGLAGGFNAIVTYPLNVAADAILSRANLEEIPVKGDSKTTGVDGNKRYRLVTESTLTFFRNTINTAGKVGLDETLLEFLTISKKQLPLRVLTSVLLFSVVNGMRENLGDTPLDDIAQSIASMSK